MNIHILPTDKPNRLVRIYNDAERKNFIIRLDGEVNDSFKEYVNVYMVNDDEIKKGSIVLSTFVIGKVPQILNQLLEKS